MAGRRQFVVFCRGMRSFFRELKRRRVYRVAIAYVIVASAMIQVGGTILATFNARLWVQQLFMVLIVTGFPFALVLGWIYDITGRGIRRTPSVSGLRVHGRRQLWLVGLTGAAAAALTLAGYWAWHPWRNADQDDSRDLPAKSIAVLPFENLSDNKQNTYFADGVQD